MTEPVAPPGPAPVALPAPLRAEKGHRVAAALTAAGCLALLIVSAWLRPAGAGHGTHEQLGLYPCVWAMTMDFPCPTCGMTTSFAHAADGHLTSAFLTQPLGALMAVVAAMLFWLGAHQAIFASRMGRMADPLLGRHTVWAGFILLGLAWIYKIAVW